MKLAHEHKKMIKEIAEYKVRSGHDFLEKYLVESKETISEEVVMEKKLTSSLENLENVKKYFQGFEGAKFSGSELNSPYSIEDLFLTNEHIDFLVNRFQKVDINKDDFNIKVFKLGTVNVLNQELTFMKSDINKDIEVFRDVLEHLSRIGCIELERTPIRTDWSKYYFFDKIETVKLEEGPFKDRDLDETIDVIEVPYNPRYGYKASDLYYLGFGLKHNRDKDRKVSKLLEVSIRVTSELHDYVERDFKSIEKYALDKTLKANDLALEKADIANNTSWTGIKITAILSMIIAVFSICLTIYTNYKNTKFWNANELKEEIYQEKALSKMDKQNELLEELITKLDKPMAIDMDDVEKAIESLEVSNAEVKDELVKLIQEYMKSTESVE